MAVSRLEHVHIEYFREQIDFREKRWLRDSGWNQTCSTPGSYWMWEKQLDGRNYIVDTSTAARIQGELDAKADREKHPEDYKED